MALQSGKKMFSVGGEAQLKNTGWNDTLSGIDSQVFSSTKGKKEKDEAQVFWAKI